MDDSPPRASRRRAPTGTASAARAGGRADPAAARNGSAYSLQVLDRAFDVLDALAARPATLTEVSTQLALNRSTVFRLLVNLERRGLVQKDEATGVYRLGIKLFQLGTLALQEQLSIQRLRPLLDALAAETCYTAQLWLRAGLEAICVDQAESPQDYRIVGRVGRRIPLHEGAVGKVLLAFAPASIAETALAAPLPRSLQHTATDAATLRAELAQIRALGYAASVGQIRIISWAVAAPVANALGAVDVAVVVVAGQGEPASPSLDAVRAAVQRTASRMSAALQFSEREHEQDNRR